MPKTLVAALAGALMLAPAFAAPARADHAAWTVGAGFHIGPVRFNVVLGRPGSSHPGYFYRTRHRLHYPRYRCTSACFKDRGYYYHDPYCPVALGHFRHHRADPYLVWDRYAPHSGRPYLHHRGRGYDRHHRYRRDPYRDFDRHRGHGRWDRHHRRSCPYRH